MKPKQSLVVLLTILGLFACDKLPLGKSNEKTQIVNLESKSESLFSEETMRQHVLNMFSTDKGKLLTALKQMENEYSYLLAEDIYANNQKLPKPISVTLTHHQIISDAHREIPKRRSQFTLLREDGSTKIGVVTGNWVNGNWTYQLGE